MLEELKKYVNNMKKYFGFLKTAIIKDLKEALWLGNNKLEQYYDIINPKVGFGEVREKLKIIKEKDLDSHKKFILSLGEKDENGKTKYENILDEVYRIIKKRNKDIDKSESEEAKKLLKEVKLNSKNIFKNLIEELQKEKNKNMKISGPRILDLIKILRGERFFFNTVENGNPKYIFFDKEYASEEISSQILQYENSQDDKKHILISRRHVGKGADLDKMEDCLLKYKRFMSYYLKEAKPYIISETWLNDTEFFEYYSKYLSDKGIDPQDKKTIRNLNLTKRLSIGDIKLSTLIQRGKSYKERRSRFVEDGETSLSTALKKYEGSGNRLQEGATILDLNKLG